jgi:[ribosomal protein S5]-alanine N-acetyltransferase
VPVIGIGYENSMPGEIPIPAPRLSRTLDGPRFESSDFVLKMADESEALYALYYYQRNQDYLRPTDPPRAPDFYSHEYWKKKVQLSLAEFYAGTSLQLFLFSRDQKAIIGSVNFSQMIRGPFQACYLGCSLDQNRQGHGLMTEALSTAIRYVFDDLQFHRVMANYLTENDKSARLLKRLGFEVEGHAKNYLYINDQWRDHVLTSLTNTNWKLKYY